MKPFPKHISGFLEYCEIEKGLSNVTVKNYANFLNPFLKWLRKNCLDNIAPKDLTAEHIRQYRLFLSRELSPSLRRPIGKETQRCYLIALRALLAYFSEREIRSLPTDKVKLPKQSKLRTIKFLNLEQLKKLFEAPDTSTKKGMRDRAILETFFSTGMRVAELVSLNVNQFPVSVFKDKNDYELTIMGKGSKPRVVYFSQRCLSWIKKYLEARGYEQEQALFTNLHSLILNQNGEDTRRLTPRSIERIIKYYSVKTGLPIFITPHTLRHTYATDLLSQGVDLRAIQEFLGHSSILTTQVYTHVTNKRLRDIYKKFHSGNTLK